MYRPGHFTYAVYSLLSDSLIEGDVLSVDIFVNCIYLSTKIPHFVDHATLKAAGNNRHLRVIADVSCDTTNPNNPIPLYDINTTFDKPTVDVDTS